jgi:NAD+ kinase
MKHIAIYPSIYRDPNREFAQTTADYLERLGVEATIIDTETKVPDTADMLITLGGDGTILFCIDRDDIANIPILGINTGNLGFMTGMDFNELNLLDDIVKGEFDIGERLMLSIEFDDKHFLALNEVTVRSQESVAVTTSVSVDGKYLKTYYGDGLIVATPTGSTAWSLSAGSIPIDPETDAILVTPVCSVDIGLKSFVANSNKRITLETSNVVLSFDGKNHLATKINEKKRIHISKADRTAKLIQPKSAPNFFNRIREKLCEHIDTRYDPRDNKE